MGTLLAVPLLFLFPFDVYNHLKNIIFYFSDKLRHIKIHSAMHRAFLAQALDKIMSLCKSVDSRTNKADEQSALLTIWRK